MIEPEVRLLLERVPELAHRYLALVEAADGDPGAMAAFGELGELVSDAAGSLAGLEERLERALAAVEEVAATSGDAADLVGGAFLENLSPDDVRLLRRWFGPATRDVLDDLELPCGRDEGRP